MTIYIISFVLNMLFGLSLCVNSYGSYRYSELNTNIKKRKIYLSITAVQLGLICGCRSVYMAYDTLAYKQIFDMCPGNWEHILDKSSYVEVGFRILCSIIKILGGDFQHLLIITSLFVMGSCCIFIYRHSQNVVLSVLIIISFPFFYSSFDIIRHFLATSFLLLGYKYVVERKLIKFLLVIFIGSLFQTSILVFIPLYFLKKVKWNWKTMGIACISTVFIYVYIQSIAIFISNIIGKSNGVESGWIGTFGGGIKTAFMYGMILLIAILAFYQLKDKNEDDMTAVNYVVLIFICSIVFINARMMTRVIMTLVAFLAIAIPQLLDRTRTKSLRDYMIMKFGFILISFTYHAFMLWSNWQNVVPYIPFWKLY